MLYGFVYELYCSGQSNYSNVSKHIFINLPCVSGSGMGPL